MTLSSLGNDNYLQALNGFIIYVSDSGEIQCEENKELPEKNKKRRFKTPSQLQALEDFYNGKISAFDRFPNFD